MVRKTLFWLLLLLVVGCLSKQASPPASSPGVGDAGMQIDSAAGSWDDGIDKATGSESPMARDRDEDGIPDNEDDCPEEYGTVRGCPDTDEDGIPDYQDKCPLLKGSMEKMGCPESDKDGDSVPDALDKCPELPGKKNWQGCPDSDADGIPDHLDKCPKEAGTQAKNGCPEQ